jgi:hypothetical protein
MTAFSDIATEFSVKLALDMAVFSAYFSAYSDQIMYAYGKY